MDDFEQMYRQGDVLLIRCDAVPPHVSRESHCTLALGEMTGHAHRVERGAVYYRERRTGGAAYLQVQAPVALLIHEEHGPIPLPGPAVYRVVIQREYDPEDPQYWTAVED